MLPRALVLGGETHALTEMWQEPQLGEGDPSSALPLVCSWGECSSFRSQSLSCKKAQLELGSSRGPSAVDHTFSFSQTIGFGARNLPELCGGEGASASGCHQGQIPPGHLCEDILET